MEAKMNKLCKGSIKPEWDEIDLARESCIQTFKKEHCPDHVIDAITMVMHELLENALKYGKYENSESRINYSVKADEKSITIEVTNPIHGEDSPNFIMLDKSIQWIRGYQNPFQSYAEKLKEVSTRPLRDNESGLGLVRIAYEGQSILDFYLGDDNQINISAVYKLEKSK
jgi:hypothetical protein